jgi:hypothetical protein
MVIRVNTVQGARPTDLQNLNELNHYIGMRVIDPHSISELRWMPWVVVSLAVAGLLAAAAGRTALVVTWLAAGLGAAVMGITDFYRWEYDYGHHLDVEHAIIRIPGMSYQPPLVGSKQLLNFTATSYPATGAWLVAILFVVVALTVIAARRQSSSTRASARRPSTVVAIRHATVSAA